MVLQTYSYKKSWDKKLDNSLDSQQTLLIIFASAEHAPFSAAFDEIYSLFPNSHIIGASTAGEIRGDELQENSLVLSIVKFENTSLKLVTQHIDSSKNSFNIGQNIANSLYNDSLKNIFILSDGLNINGSQLTSGLASIVHSDVIVSGGLAGDGDRFHSTWVLVDGKPQSDYVSGVGFYGEHIHIKYNFKGGWDKFGIQRKVTRSEDNILYELDNKPALDIYKEYLGQKAKELPASGLLFPLELQEDKDNGVKTVRTILAVNEEEQSITFAGDIPEGSMVSLMKANHDRLIDGAYQASKEINLQNYKDEEILCIAISCIGRKLVLKQRIEDELEATLENLPPKVQQIGFYSYGEISPIGSGECDLHNQTMTLTILWESNASST